MGLKSCDIQGANYRAYILVAQKCIYLILYRARKIFIKLLTYTDILVFRVCDSWNVTWNTYLESWNTYILNIGMFSM